MADEASTAGTSSCQVTGGESLESTIEINIKTLDSKIYTFQVDKDMPVPKLKEKLVDVSGVPVERQRLIFRGKVLKDDHLLSEYHLEDGHTLHLVARQPIEGQSSSGTGPEGTAQNNNNNQGGDSTSGVPRNRVGVSHSVLLGTVNVADQGDSMMADIGRLVGAVLNSLGVGTGAPTASASGTPPATASNQAPSGAEAERSQNASGNPVTGNPSSPGFTFLNQQFQSLHQIPQFPLTGFPSRHMTIPDSLTTLSEFISRMEQALQNEDSQSSPTTNLRDPLQTESPSFVPRGLPTPDTLRTVMEQAQQLLRGNATAALSRVASRLEREGTSTDTAVRGQIQAEAMHVGAAMQHLGAMLLELGRTIMTLRMGQSPADSAVNAGPAVYISPAGPNPIMVQPFPLQTNSLFGVSPTPSVDGISGPIPTGDPSRNINIHIHAGNPNAATRASTGEAIQADRSNAQQASRNGNSTGDSVPPRGLSSRTVVAAIPARPTAQSAGHVLSVIYPVHVRSQLSVPTHSASAQVSNPTARGGAQPADTVVPQPSSESSTLSNIVAQISAQVINALAGGAQGLSLSSQGAQSADAQSADAQGSGTQFGMTSHVDQSPVEANASTGNAQGQHPSPNAESTDSTGIGEVPQQVSSDSLSLDMAWGDVKGDAANVDSSGGESTPVISNVPGPSMPRSEGEKFLQESSYESKHLGSTGGSGIDSISSITTSIGRLPVCQRSSEVSNDKLCKNKSDSVATNHTSQSGQSSESDGSTPLGLGLGDLQLKRRGKTLKSVGKDKVSHETLSVNKDQQSIVRGQQFLHSLLPQNSNADVSSTNGPANAKTSLIGQIMDGLPLGRQGTNGQGQVDAADMMSQILRTPAFNNLLTGVAEQTGIGSSVDLSSMLEQCTQSPAVRNTLNDIAQQVEGQPQSGGALLSGVGRGQGGLDFSRIIQQMMPAVSQVLGRGSTRSTPTYGMQPDRQTQGDYGRGRRDEMLHERNSLVDLERAVERIEQHDAPENIFRAVLENAGHLVLEGNSFDELVNTLVNDEELTNEFMSLLCRDLHRRMQSDSTSDQ